MAVSRYQAEVDTTVRLRVRFEQNQTTLIDPFEITQVEILDPDDNVVATLASGFTKESTGIWYVDWPIPDTATVGVYHDRWTWRPYDGYDLRTGTLAFTVFAAGTFQASDAYMTASQIQTLGFIDSGSPLTDSDIDYLARIATAFIERCCGQRFVPWSDTIDVDGSGKLALKLPDSHPIQSLSSATNLDTGTAIDLTNFRSRGSWVVHKDFRAWPHRQQGDIDPTVACLEGDTFPRGFKNIRITGTFGKYTTVPELLQHALGLMVKAAGADDTKVAPWILNYVNESVDGQSVTYRDMDPGSRKKAFTGIPEVDAILNNYENRSGRIVSLSR